MLFDSATQQFNMIDAKTKSYIVMDKNTMQAMQQRMSQAMQMMQERMKSLPPAQQAQMHQMMMSQMGGMNPNAAQAEKKPNPPTVKNTGEKKKVNGFECEVYTASRDGAKVADTCITNYQSLGISAEDYNTINKMGEFQQQFSSQAMHMQQDAFRESMQALQKNMLPVQSISPTGVTQSELKKVSTESLPDTEFSIPKEFTQKKMPGEK